MTYIHMFNKILYTYINNYTNNKETKKNTCILSTTHKNYNTHI